MSPISMEALAQALPSSPPVIAVPEDLPLEDGQKTPHVEKQKPVCPVTGHGASPDAVCPVAHAMYTQEIDTDAIRTSLPDRVLYLQDFLGFGPAQQKIIHKVAPMVNDFIPTVVDDLYTKLFEFDVTKRVFMERGRGFDGDLPSKLEDLKLDNTQITYRKIFMKSWARRVLTSDYSNGKTWTYMDKVGIMHTGVTSFKHRASTPLYVPYRDCALTLGWVLTVLQTAILKLPEDVLPMTEKIDAVAAINMVIWIQNDLFARHYIDE